MPESIRTDEQIAALMYGEPEKKEEQEAPGDPDGKVGNRNLDEIAQQVYPPPRPRYAPVSDTGEVSSIIRDVEGNILHGQEGGVYSDIRDMIQINAQQLTNADLQKIDFAEKEMLNARMSGANLCGSSFHGSLQGTDLSFADLRDVDFKNCNLKGVNLTDARMDHLTDLEGVDLEGAIYNYPEIRRCKNWQLAKNLRMGKPKK